MHVFLDERAATLTFLSRAFAIMPEQQHVSHVHLGNLVLQYAPPSVGLLQQTLAASEVCRTLHCPWLGSNSAISLRLALRSNFAGQIT